ncbi:linker for activation of T-cells family member 2 isoform X2 [Corvus cornix cornix]|uniref:linker for activation of T-cells family member 2 isoform X1 n=2 Tax=Corvus cornix cornix TaxID=932674 RepID=UPI001950C0E9|nr:linker for activation of T-cells family member 2 isoform X1 [Corvus cornix cornix]XP_019143107.3 linker for activation of T-cells family member 2 isoform X2 [Corvus cornix cornix]
MLGLVIHRGQETSSCSEPGRNRLQPRQLRPRGAGGDGTQRGERLRLWAGFGWAMVQPELWAAAALMLLGAALSLCLKCQRSATKRETQLHEQRSQLESQQRFEVIRSHTTATRRLEKIKEPENFSIARKATEELSASCHTGYGSRDESRYQNFLAENCLQEDAAYVEPISLDYYYNCTRFFAPPRGSCPGKQEKDEDSYSYENVTTGASQGSDPDDTVDYENSMAIHTWKLQQGQAPLTESPDDEPDYINAGPVSGPALLSEQSILHEV